MFLLEYGFTKDKRDYNLYVVHAENKTFLLILYVVNLLVT